MPLETVIWEQVGAVGRLTLNRPETLNAWSTQLGSELRQVLEQTARAYDAGQSLPFPQRLIEAMRSGEAAGGDKRGKQSAALLIYAEEEWSALDLRVDDHPDPLGELERLEKVSREIWARFRGFLPTRANPGPRRPSFSTIASASCLSASRMAIGWSTSAWAPQPRIQRRTSCVSAT